MAVGSFFGGLLPLILLTTNAIFDELQRRFEFAISGIEPPATPQCAPGGCWWGWYCCLVFTSDTVQEGNMSVNTPRVSEGENEKYCCFRCVSIHSLITPLR